MICFEHKIGRRMAMQYIGILESGTKPLIPPTSMHF
jgi:hypothetical protein